MNTARNVVVVSTYRRPSHTRLCLEAIARAWRWAVTPDTPGWADMIAVCLPVNWREYPDVQKESQRVFERNQDVPFEFWLESCPSNPHAASRWMLDQAFAIGAEIALYVEDDVVLAPDAFLFCEYAKQAYRHFGNPEYLTSEEDEVEYERDKLLKDRIAGCCCYHETIPEQYVAEGRTPDRRLVHLYNGLNTCGGTAFLREPYLRYLAPEWNGKQVEPKGFDYSAHFSMYQYGLFMLNPDWSRSAGIGSTGGQLSYAQWAEHFGKSITISEYEAVRKWDEFRLSSNPAERAIVKEPWMEAEIEWRKQNQNW